MLVTLDEGVYGSLFPSQQIEQMLANIHYLVKEYMVFGLAQIKW